MKISDLNINWKVWALALLYALIETAHFGWNLWPKSGEEMICDGIVFILMAVALR
jgi:hypothetical protein